QQVGLITTGRDAAERLRLQWEKEAKSRTAAQESAAMSETNDHLAPLVIETRRGVEQLQRMRELLARVELSAGLTFPQLIGETSARLPRDATVLAVLAECLVETALTLGSLRRRGYAVTVVLVLFDDIPLEKAHGRLMAEG